MCTKWRPLTDSLSRYRKSTVPFGATSRYSSSPCAIRRSTYPLNERFFDAIPAFAALTFQREPVVAVRRQAQHVRSRAHGRKARVAEELDGRDPGECCEIQLHSLSRSCEIVDQQQGRLAVPTEICK